MQYLHAFTVTAATLLSCLNVQPHQLTSVVNQNRNEYTTATIATNNLQLKFTADTVACTRTDEM